MKRATWLIALAGLCAATHLVHRPLRAERAAAGDGPDRLHLPPPGWLAASSLGYREALASLLWVRLVIFTGDLESGRDWRTIMTGLDAIGILAPRFRRPYLWGAITYVYTGERAIDRAMIDRALEISRLGLAQFPEDPDLLFMTGMLLVRDVQSVAGYDELERRRARAEGIELIRRSASFGAPPVVRQYAATLTASDATDELALQFLEQQLLQADDPQLRAYLQTRLAELGATDRSARLAELAARLRAARLARYPYLDDERYSLIAGRELEELDPLELAWQARAATSSP